MKIFQLIIKKDMDGKMKRLANPSKVQDKFTVFGEMISEEDDESI